MDVARLAEALLRLAQRLAMAQSRPHTTSAQKSEGVNVCARCLTVARASKTVAATVLPSAPPAPSPPEPQPAKSQVDWPRLGWPAAALLLIWYALDQFSRFPGSGFGIQLLAAAVLGALIYPRV
jgi:hypothetical protein